MSENITEATEDNKIEQKDSIKISKNTKGYNYEFRLLRGKDETLQEFFNKVAAFNDMMAKQYGATE